MLQGREATNKQTPLLHPTNQLVQIGGWVGDEVGVHVTPRVEQQLGVRVDRQVADHSVLELREQGSHVLRFSFREGTRSSVVNVPAVGGRAHSCEKTAVLIEWMTMLFYGGGGGGDDDDDDGDNINGHYHD